MLIISTKFIPFALNTVEYKDGTSMTNTSIEKNLSVGLRMGEILKLLGRKFSQAIPDHGIDLTFEQFILLNVINGEEEANQQQLSLIMHKDKSGILRITDELERKKMVVRIADTADRRKKALVLTKKGLETLNRVIEIEAEVIDKLMTGVTEEELSVFGKVLEKIQRNGTR